MICTAQLSWQYIYNSCPESMNQSLTQEIFGKRGTYLDDQRLVRGFPFWHMAIQSIASPPNFSSTASTGRHPSTTCSSSGTIRLSLNRREWSMLAETTENNTCILTNVKDVRRICSCTWNSYWNFWWQELRKNQGKSRVINVSSEWSIMLQDSKSWKRLDANVDMWHTLPFAMSLLFCLYIFRISFRINVSRPYLLVQYNCTWLLVLVFFKISVPGRTQLISQPGSCPPRNK